MKKVNKKTCPTNLTGFIHGTDISECWILGYSGGGKKKDPHSVGTHTNGKQKCPSIKIMNIKCKMLYLFRNRHPDL